MNGFRSNPQRVPHVSRFWRDVGILTSETDQQLLGEKRILNLDEHEPTNPSNPSSLRSHTPYPSLLPNLQPRPPHRPRPRWRRWPLLRRLHHHLRRRRPRLCRKNKSPHRLPLRQLSQTRSRTQHQRRRQGPPRRPPQSRQARTDLPGFRRRPHRRVLRRPLHHLQRHPNHPPAKENSIATPSRKHEYVGTAAPGCPASAARSARATAPSTIATPSH